MPISKYPLRILISSFVACLRPMLTYAQYAPLVRCARASLENQTARVYHPLKTCSCSAQKAFLRLAKDYPNAKSPLFFHSSFQLLIAVLLSAHTTDVGVNKVTRRLFKIAPNPQKMLALGESTLKKEIRSIGLYNAKAANIIKICRILIEKYNSHVPRTRDALEALPGVGRKTANVVLNVAFHEPTIAVDTHVFRVANRTGFAPGKTPLIVEQKLLKIVPKKFIMEAHYLLLWHGRLICKARKPNCPACSINGFCSYPYKTK
jgi:endonuclease III